MDQDREKAEERQPPMLEEGNRVERTHPPMLEKSHRGEETNPGDTPPTDERFQFNDNLWKHVRREQSKKGIVYLTDVPIGLTAARLREIFSQYGSVSKIHLNKAKDEEGEEEREGFLSSHLRKKDGPHLEGKKKKKKKKIVKYQDGYIEFDNKKDAMKAVRTLNNQLIGGKKRKNIVRDYFWHLKLIKDNFLWSDIMSSSLYRRMSRKDKFTLALKDMYKGYEAYVEKNGGSTHGMLRSGEGPTEGKSRHPKGNIQKGSGIQKGGRQRKRKNGPRVKRPVCPLRFVTVKKGGESNQVTEEVPLEVSNQEPASFRRNSSAVSADLLKLLM
ncbi:hypothetical protein C922_04363 [Plasmodium inui San Antonio 1]|uniref:RRM domain-containing protein n=1 Tax=Plasmodium inui San Antonio 1 TaxID=1237626 RepID=W7A7X9_9APIC|nr:hypothetical protein C922_04363 [Plasmodium inui San Antonio 1]EUD65234.1 hypothetical protein C922_04363 [Plasmodium inui San Antonio 1]